MSKHSKTTNKTLVISIIACAIAIIGATIAITTAVLNNTLRDGESAPANYTETEKTQINTMNYNAAAVLETSLIQYQTYNLGNLPTIPDGVSGSTDGSGNSEIANYYRDYFGDLKAFNGKPYTINFVNNSDLSKMAIGIDYLNVFYYATCNESGDLVPHQSRHHFAVVFTDADEKLYYCLGE